MFLLVILLVVVGVSAAVDEYFHYNTEQHKLQPGWQEPGLWRPKWIMEREFYAVEGQQSKRDRIYFKMKPDRTLEIFSSRKRPFLELFKPRSEDARSKQLFENEGVDAPVENKWNKGYDEIGQLDGTWWWQSEAPLPTGKVKIETREGENYERIMHDTRCDWGKLDGYAAKFRRGKIFRYKGAKTSNGIPLGNFVAGTFTIKASIHRPLVAKDFQAFQ